MDFTAASPPPEIGSIACDAASTDALADDRSRIAQSVTKTVHADLEGTVLGRLGETASAVPTAGWKYLARVDLGVSRNNYARTINQPQAWENRENANKNVKKAKWRREQDQA